MVKVNKNIDHNGQSFKKGDEVKDESLAAELLKLGHAEDDGAKPAKASKGAGKKANESAEDEDAGGESFDDLSDEGGDADLPPTPAPAPKAAKGAKAASKKAKA